MRKIDMKYVTNGMIVKIRKGDYYLCVKGRSYLANEEERRSNPYIGTAKNVMIGILGHAGWEVFSTMPREGKYDGVLRNFDIVEVYRPTHPMAMSFALNCHTVKEFDEANKTHSVHYELFMCEDPREYEVNNK